MSVKILVVDDEPDLHLLIRQKFKRQTTDWAFVFADDGVEALEMIEADPEIDLVLTDLNMPRMDGLTLLARIAEMDRPLRVVIVSAYGDMKNIRAAMNQGAYDFVTKPVNLNDLEATIHKTWQEVEAQKKALEAHRQLEAVRNALAVSQEVQTLKTRFFANLSHEFRTPLTLILGPLQDALHGADGPLAAEQVAVMHRHALRLKHLIDQLLDLSKLEAGRMTLRAGRHDVRSFLHELVLSFAPAAERKQIALRFVAPGKDEMLLYYEPDKLEKIVANLLSNAIKFTPAHGTIRVSVGPFEDAHVDLVVRDNGPGIPAGELPHLFDRFYRVDASGARHHPGTGIGLSPAKELVVLHGGQIFAESGEGFGSTFTVALAAREGASPTRRPR
ncbi:MAG: hybrid sensor histidine kinase/response regulator [Bacteroidetes bacterium]|nr:hybrid sensor histidine kinase/response regulator [Bacteroidota bacterium]